MEVLAIDKNKIVTENQSEVNHYSRNCLFPIFLKLENLETIIVGGGNIALEKLRALINNSPDAKVELLAKEIKTEVKEFLIKYKIPFREKLFEEKDITGKNLVIVAIDDQKVSAEIHKICERQNILVNVADTPDYCDFYLSSIVQKGNLKIAISTNGKSPTIAKRVKDILNDAFPDEINDVLNNMEVIRKKLSGDFKKKVFQLNNITSVLTLKTQAENSKQLKIEDSFIYVSIAIGLIIGFLLGEYL
ncbi:precorrin-2 dehydrogenase/sirohydrochlorin ferrochelatase family protein [Solitalea koreensis]|uniref:precorrin-2 dehydrogenase n=1 Tax=Solitalea koreensis TaxID=543615 RepID=A0A521DAT0_9SPHI|nr:bifunctional precorrin-2 dehydrogenase/sirohydrochlorin ferrochelatase [Solitalea koreensis]SMO67990.1 precorrin-2 dehydrogenase / sirohydrochlorin ferrochelatase [Solitalea koreensis]